MRNCFLLLALGVSATIPDLAAQLPQQLATGARVRVTAPSSGLVRAIGRIESFNVDSLVLVRDRGGGTVRLTATSLQSLEVSRGRRRHIAAGVALGYALMFGLGFAGHPGVAHTDAGPFLEGIGYGIVYGTPVALLGGILGASVRTDRWERIPLPLRTGVAPVAPRDSGIW
jgi:hypothetical protein